MAYPTQSGIPGTSPPRSFSLHENTFLSVWKFEKGRKGEDDTFIGNTSRGLLRYLDGTRCRRDEITYETKAVQLGTLEGGIVDGTIVGDDL